MAILSLWPHVVGGTRELSEVSFKRALMELGEFHPPDLITSQRPHLRRPWCWGLDFNLGTLGKQHAYVCAHSVVSDSLDKKSGLYRPWTIACQASLSIGIVQARILEWVAISFSRGSSPPRGWNFISFASCIGSQILYHCATWEAPQCIATLKNHSPTEWLNWTEHCGPYGSNS